MVGCRFEISPVGAWQQPVVVEEVLQPLSVQKRLSLLKQPDTTSQLRRSFSYSACRDFKTLDKVANTSRELPFALHTANSEQQQGRIE